MKTWDLTILYNGFDTEKYKNDLKAFEEQVRNLVSFAERAEKTDTKQIYNMNGQRFIKKVEELRPGVYIINGVKRIIGVR